MKETDRERYAAEVLFLGGKLAQSISSGEAGIDDDAVWDVYARVEKLIAVLKFRLDYETPGAFTKLPDPSDPMRLLGDAREILSRSAGEIAGGRLIDAVGTLREARNNLRSYLTAKRKAATRGSVHAESGAAGPSRVTQS